MSKLTHADLDRTISACRVVPLRPDRETQALLDHLERSPAPRIPRVGRAVIPLRTPWWARVWRHLFGERT